MIRRLPHKANQFGFNAMLSSGAKIAQRAAPTHLRLIVLPAIRSKSTSEMVAKNRQWFKLPACVCCDSESTGLQTQTDRTQIQNA
jgi:hypothetical protein